jgi:ribosomal protein L37AE/L43A
MVQEVRNLEVVRPTSLAMPEMDVEMAVQRFQQIGNFVKSIMAENVDFGVIPGTKNKTLLKPGAEKLCTFFGLTKEVEILDKELDWTGQDHGGEPFFYMHYKIRLSRNGRLIAEADGSANSWESKHRYRQGEYKCPKCEKETIRRSSEDRGGGWYCWAKIGGCGAKFPKGDAAIESQVVGKRKNPDPADLVNTIQKMAYKRALIAATLVAVNASEYFTQDMDDLLSGKNDKGDPEPHGSSGKPPTEGSQKTAKKQEPGSPGPSPESSVNGPISLTIPDIVNACKKNLSIAEFPVVIITTKKVAIGKWLNRYWEGEVLHVVFDMTGDMEQATGITKEKITNKFKEAGYKVVFQEPGTAKEVQTPKEQVTPPAQKAQETTQNNDEGKAKSLF